MSDKSVERALLVQDVLVIVLSLWISHVLRGRLAELLPALKPAVPLGETLQILLVFLPTWVWCAERLELHRVRTLFEPVLDLCRTLLFTQAWGALALGLILMAAQAPFNRSYIVIHLGLSTILLLVGKIAQRRWVRGLRGEVTALVVGEMSPELLEEHRDRRGRTVEVLGSVDPEKLRARFRDGGVDEVVFASPLTEPVLRPLLAACLEAGTPALVRVEAVDVDLARPRPSLVGSGLYLAYDVQEPDHPSRWVKALFDRVTGLLLLLVTWPLLVLIALMVKMSSPGPVFFVQSRGGLNGRPFSMLKFRTMRVGAEAERDRLLHANEMDGPVFKIADDPRVAPLGGFLRRTSLDELPQLVNVVLGHMSLVGPRPLPVVETRALAGAHRRRLSVRPGITGLWQVSGRNQVRFEQWMAMDLEYVDRWSLGLDLAILLRTVPALLSRRGAQ